MRGVHDQSSCHSKGTADWGWRIGDVGPGWSEKPTPRLGGWHTMKGAHDQSTCHSKGTADWGKRLGHIATAVWSKQANWDETSLPAVAFLFEPTLGLHGNP